MHTLFKKLVTVFCILLASASTAFSSSNISLSNLSGGKGGSQFVVLAGPKERITEIAIRSGNYIDAIGITYSNGKKNIRRTFGGKGGKKRVFKLKKGEVITEIGGKSGKYVDSIYIRTNKKRHMKWGGNGGSRNFKIKGTKKNPIIGIWGRSGSLIDAIGVVRKLSPGASGGAGGVATSSLGGFDPTRPSDAGDQSCDKCDAAPTSSFPGAPTNNNDREFWKVQNQRLFKVVKKLAGPKSVFDGYLSKEKKSCGNNIFCQIDTRSDAITHVIGVQ